MSGKATKNDSKDAVSDSKATAASNVYINAPKTGVRSNRRIQRLPDEIASAFMTEFRKFLADQARLAGVAMQIEGDSEFLARNFIRLIRGPKHTQNNNNNERSRRY